MKKLALLITLVVISSGCVEYKYNTWPNGVQIQPGAYIESPVLQSSFYWTKNGKRITEMNEEYERLHFNTNKTNIK